MREALLERGPFEEADDVPLGWDASQGSDAGVDVALDPLLLPASMRRVSDTGGAGGEWGSDGALMRALLSASLTDVAPRTVRERVLLAVDAAMSAAKAGPTFPAEAAPVTTLSGVFEKRPPASEAAYCVESSLDPAAVDASIQQSVLEKSGLEKCVLEKCSIEHRPIQHGAAVASFERACIEVPSSSAAVSVPPGLVRVDAGARGAVGASPAARSAASKPIRAVPLAGHRVIDGLVGTLSRDAVSRDALSSHALSSDALSSAGFPGEVFSSRVLPDASGVVASNLDALGASERSRWGRLRDGVVASALNLAQLAAAIVVGVGIGKVGHLVMAEEHPALSSARASGGLRAEPSDAFHAVRVPTPVRASEPGAQVVRSWAAQPTNVATAAGSWAAERTKVSSGSGSGAPSSRNWLGPASARPPLSRASAQSSARQLAGSQLAARQLAASQLAANQLAGNARPAVAPASEDWLGEQLVILGKAERSLLEGDPDSAVRSLDEYQSRFPDGLLDPQMASIRRRAGERSSPFIFP